MVIEESKQPAHETVEIRVGNGGAVEVTPEENSNKNDGIQEITQIISSTKKELQPIDEVINEALSIAQGSDKAKGIKIDAVEHHSRNSAGSRGSGKGSPRATDAAGF